RTLGKGLAGKRNRRAKLWIADLTRLLSCGNRAGHRAAVQHQLVAAHVDNDLSVIGSALPVELRRNHDAKTRGLALVHGNKKEIPVSETEQARFGRIVKIDLRQVSELCRNVERQTSGLQKGARDRLVSCGGSRASRGREGEARDKCDRDAADNGEDTLHDGCLPEFIYWNDDGEPVAIRVQDWKVVFKEQNNKGIGVWRKPSRANFRRCGEIRVCPQVNLRHYSTH